MAIYRKSRVRYLSLQGLLVISVLGFILLSVLLGLNGIVGLASRYASENAELLSEYTLDFKNLKLPKQNRLSIQLEKLNRLPPRNLDLYPELAHDHIVIVLYVHNRPQYLRVAIDSLSNVLGINETLLIVSHDGYFDEMNKIVESIMFCQVKQIFAPFSPHVFPDRFPGTSQFDCKDKDQPTEVKCTGNADQYGNHRSSRIVSLKHHWWWMMNTVWDGLDETSGHSGYVLFFEEDHFIYPNAYRNLQLLTQLKPMKCPYCYAANLAPCNVDLRGEGFDVLVAEQIGNVGYAFNQSIWTKIHRKAKSFCLFDDYNWDITMWSAVYPSFGEPVYTFRGPRTSAVHFGKCGLHQGNGEEMPCIDSVALNFVVESIDRVPNIDAQWELLIHKYQGYKAGFHGWGGWGDTRDHQLCLDFARIYRVPMASNSR